MYKKNHQLLASLLSLGLTPGLLAATETTEVVLAPTAEPSVNEVELGLGYIANDAYHFGRYNGMIDQGPYIIGDIKAKHFYDDASFWRLRGTNLGLDSRYMRIDAGKQGTVKFNIEYDQLPDYENNTGTTPFVNPGSTHLVLPSNYDYYNLDNFLLPFDQETERKRLGLGVKLQIKSNWDLSGNVSHETKQGTDWTGAAMGPSPPVRPNLFKYTTGSLLPEPIDFETDKLNATLSYQGKQTQMEFAYNGSLFYNNNTSLSWTDPEPNPDTRPTAELYRPGRMSLEPDNQMHQLSALLAHMLSPTNRVTALASVSHLTQDEKFLPYSVYDTVDSLPRTSLDGEVWLYRGQLKLDSRPIRRLSLTAQYSYDARDNQTEQNDYYYSMADGIPGEILPQRNDPLSYTRNKLDLSANYRFNSIVSLRGGYEYNKMNRDYDEEERKTTRENTFKAKLKVKPLSQFNFDLYGERGRRHGSAYNTRDRENPKNRVFYFADLERDKAGIVMNYMPTNRLNFNLKTEYVKDDYVESEIGLKDSKQKSTLFNVNYRITDKINTHAFYNYQEFRSNNANEDLEQEKGTFEAWEAILKDTTHSFGLGLKISELAKKWDAGVDWVYTRSTGQIDMSGVTAEVDPETGVITSDFLPIDTQQFSDLKTSLSSLQLWTKYQYSDKIAYKLSYWYEHYSSEDWSVDGTVNNYADLTNDTIAQMLLLGEERLDYTQHVIGLSVNVQF